MVALTAYTRFIKVGESPWDENNISSLICFGVIITDAVDAFALNHGLSLNVDNVLNHVSALVS